MCFLLWPPASKHCAFFPQLNACAPTTLPLQFRVPSMQLSLGGDSLSFSQLLTDPKRPSLVLQCNHLCHLLKAKSLWKLASSKRAYDLTKSGLFFQANDSALTIHPSYVVRFLLHLIFSRPPTGTKHSECSLMCCRWGTWLLCLH